MSTKKIKSKYTNDEFVPIKSITNGVIVLDNNEKVTGVKIMPRNIFILDYSTQYPTCPMSREFPDYTPYFENHKKLERKRKNGK